MPTWQDKAHRLIAQMCFASWQQAQLGKTGKRLRKHQPYSVPVIAQHLVECLGHNDEEGAKAIFLNFDMYGAEYKR